MGAFWSLPAYYTFFQDPVQNNFKQADKKPIKFVRIHRARNEQDRKKYFKFA